MADLRCIFASMSDRSPIEWTDATWNPVRGCSKVSPGCAHCYAERFAERFRDVPGHPFERGFDPRLAPDMLYRPLAWRRPRRIFVNSMSDLFHADVPVEYIAAVGRVMQQADWHTFQVLTKRHHRMRRLLSDTLRWMGALPNVWFGVSVENRRHGFPRLTALRRTPATVRFASMEPLLEDLGAVDLTDIDWVIAGGESGPGARAMRINWIVDLERECRRQGVPFFFKQWGGVRKHATGRTLNGRTYSAFPSTP